jgi:hypothetical protein
MNQDIRDKYPSTYGFFAPSSPNDKFDITAYEDQFRKNERKTLSPEEQSKQANARVGLWQYHKMRDQFIQANGGDPLDSGQKEILSIFNDSLKDQYPGYKTVTYDTSRLPTAIDELTAAAKDPKLASSDAGKGLNAYLNIRDEAMVLALGLGYKTPFRAGGALFIREWMRGAALDIVRQHPSFGPMWEQIWSHELKSDPQLATAAGAA